MLQLAAADNMKNYNVKIMIKNKGTEYFAKHSNFLIPISLQPDGQNT